MRKPLARCVISLLTVYQKWNHTTISKQFFNVFNCIPSEFLRRYVTIAEKWIHYYILEMKQEIFCDEYDLKKTNSFIGQKGHDYNFLEFLAQFHGELMKKRPHFIKKNLFSTMTMHSHICNFVVKTVELCCNCSLIQSDFPPYDFFHFANKKNRLVKKNIHIER